MRARTCPVESWDRVELSCSQDIAHDRLEGAFARFVSSRIRREGRAWIQSYSFSSS